MEDFKEGPSLEEKNKSLCEGCNGQCCKYIVIEIDFPEEEKDFEEIKWYVCHKNISVFVDEEDKWNVEFLTPCEHLGEEGLCKIYSKRPGVCREYSQEECPFHNEYKEKYVFKKIEEVEEYIENVFKKGKHQVPEEDEEEDEGEEEE